MAKRYHQVAPPELLEAVEMHARAVFSADRNRAQSFVLNQAVASHDTALERIGAIRPLAGYEMIARARLGHQYLVKVRFRGVAGDAVTLQDRWRLDDDHHNWRIAEVDDIGVRLPWVKPEKPQVEASNA